MKDTITSENITSIVTKLYATPLNKGYTIDITPPKRSNLQNSALHLYFTIISRELTNLGITHDYKGISGKQFEIPYTSELVKNFIWRPIQLALFEKKSTTKLTTKEINEIVDVLIKFFAEKGIQISFPNIQDLLHKKDYEDGK